MFGQTFLSDIREERRLYVLKILLTSGLLVKHITSSKKGKNLQPQASVLSVLYGGRLIMRTGPGS